jgi:hypothetical protein
MLVIIIFLVIDCWKCAVMNDASPSMGVNDHCSTKYSFYFILFVCAFFRKSIINHHRIRIRNGEEKYALQKKTCILGLGQTWTRTDFFLVRSGPYPPLVRSGPVRLHLRSGRSGPVRFLAY